MRHPRPLVASAALTLTAALIGGAPQPAVAEPLDAASAAQVVPAGPEIAHATPSTRSASLVAARTRGKWPAKKVIAVTAADTEVPAGTPPAQQLASATIVQDLVKGTISAQVRLKAAPTGPDTDSNILVVLGRVNPDNGWCYPVGDAGAYWQAYGTNGQSAPGLLRNGASMELVGFPSVDAKKDQFNCAYAEAWSYPPDDPAQFIDLLDGRGDFDLDRIVDKPKLAIKAPKKTAAQVNRWQKVKVKIRNTNPRVTAPGVKVKVTGKKVTAKTKKIGKLKPGKSKRIKVNFQVRPGHRGKAKIVVTTKNVRKQKALRLR